MPTKSSSDPLILEAFKYLERVKSPIQATSVLLPSKSPIGEEQKKKRMELEGQELLKKSKSSFRIALHEEGQKLSSRDLAKYLAQLMHKEPKVAFIIGGAFGLSEELLLASDDRLSLSPMTMPHRMAFLFMCEQIYRANEILRGSPYHK